ncbi:poly [ADP-ribose] polymerase tankyrase-2-like [Mya arenaria]|uniref:poly [ADP-ribose] polymerase tankyrase-2-like n=1 Tax=Mya arenaria TaxID=6604 RepID=UPI0022E651D6|nr:poly [ADP-ribose] polymerase tankyrase-2-like [Mya arenaria]
MGLAASRQEEFWEACGFGHVGRAKQLLAEGDIDVNWVSYTNDCSPIHVASQGKPDIVQLLLENKCDVNVKDARGNLAIHHAAMKGHGDIVKTLIDAGSEIDAQEKNGWTALHNAAYWCHPDVVNVLIKNGCDVHKQNKDERTALHECARSQQKNAVQLGEIARSLIKAGCNVNSKSSDWGEADLTGLMYAAFHNHPEVAMALIDAGCELNAVGGTFWTALHWAADRDNDELVYILLDAGINPTIRDMRGETALERARSDQMKDILKTAIDIHKEMNVVNTTPILQTLKAVSKPASTYKPACDANFKSKSFLPADWKPVSNANVKNLINEKKSKLAAMTSQKYRTELARRTGTNVIEDQKISDKSGDSIGKSGDSGTNVIEDKQQADGTGDKKGVDDVVKNIEGTDVNDDLEKDLKVERSEDEKGVDDIVLERAGENDGESDTQSNEASEDTATRSDGKERTNDAQQDNVEVYVTTKTLYSETGTAENDETEFTEQKIDTGLASNHICSSDETKPEVETDVTTLEGNVTDLVESDSVCNGKDVLGGSNS